MRSVAGVTLLGLVLSALGQSPLPVVIHMENGDRFSGVIVSQETNHWILKTEWGTLSIPQASVVRTEAVTVAGGNRTGTLTNGTNQVSANILESQPDAFQQQLQELSLQYAKGKISPSQYHRRRAKLLEQATQSGIPRDAWAEASQPSELREPSLVLPPDLGGPGRAVKSSPGKGKEISRWHGEALVGTDLAFSTKDRQLFTGRLKAAYKDDGFNTALDYLFTYGKTDGDLSANRMKGTLKTDWRIKDRAYFYNLGGGGYDEIRKIDVAYELGPGVGYHLVQGERFNLSTEFGVQFQREERTSASDTERFYYRLADSATWKINSRLSLEEKFEFLPQVEDLERYRFRLEANLRYLLAGNLSFLVTVLDQYDTHPARNVDRNDVQVRSAVGVKF